MVCSNEIPKLDGYYWVKLQYQWQPEVVHYFKGVVYTCGNRGRLSPYEDVYFWGDKIEKNNDFRLLQQL